MFGIEKNLQWKWKFVDYWQFLSLDTFSLGSRLVYTFIAKSRPFNSSSYESRIRCRLNKNVPESYSTEFHTDSTMIEYETDRFLIDRISGSFMKGPLRALIRWYWTLFD